MAEVRNMREGTLRWVYASGSGTAWATASAPTSGLLGYVRSFTLNSGRTTVQVMDRGKPMMQKLVSEEPIQASFQVAYGVTGDYPNVALTGSGHSMPGMLHLEFKATAAEAGAALYHQLYGVAINSINLSEGAQEDTLDFSCVALRQNGPTASGYLG